MSETGRCAFMPINLLGKTVRVNVKQSGWVPHTKIWCCFIDPEANKPYVGYLRVEQMETLGWLHNTNLYRVKTVDLMQKTLKREVQHRTNEKRNTGFRRIPGNWHISRPGGGLINFDRLSSSDKKSTRILSVGVNGIGHTQSADSTEKAVPSLPNIQTRLSEVNPVADSWFFTD